MLIIIIIYFVFFALAVNITKKKSLKFVNIPYVKVKKNGFIFYSKRVHRIKKNNMNVSFISNSLFLKTENKVVVISNVSNVEVVEGYIYFKGLGEVKIIDEIKEIFRYFSIHVSSKIFNWNKLKQDAIVDYLNNSFDVKFSEITKKYFKLIENVLKIQIFKEKILIKKNSLNFPLSVKYKLNNVLKTIIINESLWNF